MRFSPLLRPSLRMTARSAPPSADRASAAVPQPRTASPSTKGVGADLSRSASRRIVMQTASASALSISVHLPQTWTSMRTSVRPAPAWAPRELHPHPHHPLLLRLSLRPPHPLIQESLPLKQALEHEQG